MYGGKEGGDNLREEPSLLRALRIRGEDRFWLLGKVAFRYRIDC